MAAYNQPRYQPLYNQQVPPPGYGGPPPGYGGPPPPYNPQYNGHDPYKPAPPLPVYYPPAAPQRPIQQTTNVVVVDNAPAPQVCHVHCEEDRNRDNIMVWHLVHLVITLIFWPWIIVWIIFCMVYGI